MVSKVILTLSVMLAVAAAVLPGGAGAWGAGGGWGPNAGAWGANADPNSAVNPWIPSWISAAPWFSFPQWGPCTTIGSSCLDCNTKQVCTKIGALQKRCSDPTLPHCNLGECSATPSAECSVDVAV